MHEWVSVAEASRRLNVSVSTVRRMIEEGKLVGEREVIGGSKERFKVRLDASDEASAAPPTSSTSEASGASESTLTVVQGMLDRLAAREETIELLYTDLRAETERRATAEAERDTLREAHADCSNLSHAEASRFVQEATEQRFRADDLATRLAQAEARLARPWWKFWE